MDIESAKQCSKCGEMKGMGDFYRQHNSKDGHCHICRLCSSRGKTYGSQKHKYGRKVKYITLKCPICGIFFDKSPSFMKQNPARKFCSRKCAGKNIRKPDGEQKLCIKCKCLKSIECFYKIPNRIDRRHVYCKDCNNLAQKKRVEQDPLHHSQRRKEITKRYLRKNPDISISDANLKFRLKKQFGCILVTPELIHAKREHVLTKRLVRKLKGEVNEQIKNSR